MDKLSIVLTILPLVLLVIYVLLNQFASKTKTKADDYIREIIGEILEGLGKEPPKPIDPLLIEREKAKDEQNNSKK